MKRKFAGKGGFAAKLGRFGETPLPLGFIRLDFAPFAGKKNNVGGAATLLGQSFGAHFRMLFLQLLQLSALPPTTALDGG